MKDTQESQEPQEPQESQETLAEPVALEQEEPLASEKPAAAEEPEAPEAQEEPATPEVVETTGAAEASEEPEAPETDEPSEGQEEPATQDVQADPIELRRKKRLRRRIGYGIAAAVVVVLVVVLQVMSNDAKQASNVTVEEKVITSTVELGDMSKTLISFGTLASADEDDISVPGSIKVTEYHVSAGDAVKKGDIIATVDRTTVLAAIADVQELIDELDAEVVELKDESISSSLTAPSDGTVVKIYAQSGDSVVDVMYDNKALALVSLDGLLAISVDNNGKLNVGDTVRITGSDGDTNDGTVADVEKEKLTITVANGTFDFDEKVSVADTSGNSLGSGKLFIYSQQKITGYSGTVSSISISEGSTVSTGDTLMTLTDTDYSADYQALLKSREKLVKQLNKLTEINEVGYVCAEEDGVISTVNEDLVNSVVKKASTKGISAPEMTTEADADGQKAEEENTEKDAGTNGGGDANKTTSANDGATGTTGNTSSGNTGNNTNNGTNTNTTTNTDTTNKNTTTTNDDTGNGGSGNEGDSGDDDDDGNDSDTSTVVIRATVEWQDSNGKPIEKGLPDSVTIALKSNIEGQLETATLKASDNWTHEFSPHPKSIDGTAVSYTVSLKGSVNGFTATTDSSGYDIVFTMTSTSDSSSGSSSSSSSASKGSASSSGASSAKQPGNSKGSAASAMPSGSKPSGGNFSAGNVSINADAVNSSGLLTTEGATIEDALTEKADPYAYSETTLGTMTPNDTVSVDITVDELDIGSIVIGSPAQVTLDALSGQRFDGKITALDPFGTNSGGNTKYTVTVSMDKRDDMLLGMNASVDIDLTSYSGILLVPEAALVEQNGKTYVYTTYDEGKDELGGLVEVTTGNADGTNVEILSGLSANQTCYYRYAGEISYTFAR